MTTRRMRLTILLVTVASAALLACAPGASAAITATHITAPTDGSYFLEDTAAPGPELKITGTVTGEGEDLELRCYASNGESTEVGEVEEEEIKNGKFSVEVLPEEIGEFPCVLRAVPTGDKASLAPGTATPFEGPRVTFSEFALTKDPSDSLVDGFDIEARTLSTVYEIDAAGTCGLGPTALVSSPSLAEGEELFRCAGALYGQPAGASRADIQVDGRNAYDPYAADEIWSRVKPSNDPPATSVEQSFDKTTGLKSLKEKEPLVECSGSKSAYPETAESCKEFVSAGITLERTWTPSDDGRLISMSDVWQSTDGKAHTVSALYVQELGSDMASPGTYQLPGGSQAFATTTTGGTFSLNSAEGAILYRADGAGEEAIGSTHPVGAIIAGTSPSGPVLITAGSAETKGSDALQMPYSFEVPASGTHKLTMAFAEGYTQHEVCLLAEEAKSGCEPSVAISTPAAGSTSAAATVSVSGTAGDAVGLSSLTVDGTPVSVTGGTWTTTVPLALGANTITAIATNEAGLTRTATTSVTYAPPIEPHHETPKQAPVTIAAKVGATKLGKGSVTLVIGCTGPAGTSCAVKVVLSTVEKLRGGHPSALAASAHSRTVTIASATVTIPAGSRRTITIKLNATGRALLARFHRLPAHLAVMQTGSSGRESSVASQTLTIIAKHR